MAESLCTATIINKKLNMVNENEKPQTTIKNLQKTDQLKFCFPKYTKNFKTQ